MRVARVAADRFVGRAACRVQLVLPMELLIIANLENMLLR